MWQWECGAHAMAFTLWSWQEKRKGVKSQRPSKFYQVKSNGPSYYIKPIERTFENTSWLSRSGHGQTKRTKSRQWVPKYIWLYKSHFTATREFAVQDFCFCLVMSVQLGHRNWGHPDVKNDESTAVHDKGCQVVGVLLIPRQPQQRCRVWWRRALIDDCWMFEATQVK